MNTKTKLEQRNVSVLDIFKGVYGFTLPISQTITVLKA